MSIERQRGAIWAVALGAFLWIGCRAREDAQVEPVQECKEYELLLASCLHRDTGFTKQPQVIPKNEQERAQIRQLCGDNLARLRTACR
jgi:hypothetical protein